jgi:hypothetical protein
MDATRHRHFWHAHKLTAGALVDRLPSHFRKVGIVNNSVLKPNSQLGTGFDAWTHVDDHQQPFERAATYIEQAKSRKPLFLLLHSNIAHDFYFPHAATYYDEVFPEDAGGSYALGDNVIRWVGTTAAEREAAIKTYQASAVKAVSSTRAILDLARGRDDFVCAVISDHGEGLAYDDARLHHGGRLHEDLLRVPLYFDLPSTIPEDQRTDLTTALASSPVATTDVLPTLFALAGQKTLPDIDGRPIDGVAGERTVVSEERRYLYLRNRFRLNIKGRNRLMSPEDQVENERLQTRLAGPPLVRSYRTHTRKLIVTGLQLRLAPESTADRRQSLREWGERLLGSPMLCFRGDRLFGFELFDLERDPEEVHNLLVPDDGAREMLLSSGRALSVTVPQGDESEPGEMDLSILLEGAELHQR